METLAPLAQQPEMAQNDQPSKDFFDQIRPGVIDPITSAYMAFQKDTDPKKVNLTIGVYRDDDQKPFVFEAVKKAQQDIVDENMDKEYLNVSGHPGFVIEAQKLIFGQENPLIRDKKVATVQTLSGTGALTVGMQFLAKFCPAKVYHSDPTWPIHVNIIQNAGLTPDKYSYFDSKTKSLAFDTMCKSIESAPAGSIVLLQLAGHNPTGVDPTPEQWRKLAQIIKNNGLLPFIDNAYQGFTSGNLETDVKGVHIFLEEGLQMLIAQSFSKNMGLYGERVGALHVVCSSNDSMLRVLDQLGLIIRPMFSNCPINGARIASKILSNPSYRQLWEKELKEVYGRIYEMRSLLYDELTNLGTPGNWDHLVKQTGMFTFIGLSPEQCQALMDKHHVYLVVNGRVNMSGLTSKNVKYVAKVIKDVVQNIN